MSKSILLFSLLLAMPQVLAASRAQAITVTCDATYKVQGDDPANRFELTHETFLTGETVSSSLLIPQETIGLYLETGVTNDANGARVLFVAFTQNPSATPTANLADIAKNALNYHAFDWSTLTPGQPILVEYQSYEVDTVYSCVTAE